MSQQKDTLVRCTDCEQVYAAYYTSESELVTPGGDRCPNCGGEQFSDIPASAI